MEKTYASHRKVLRRSIVILLGFLALAIVPPGSPSQQSTGDFHSERFLAIDNVCAWPNLTLFKDGTILATIFNLPSHGLLEGDLECWASKDGGRLWKRVGVPAAHEPGTARMHAAAGLAHDGSLIVLAGGWGGIGGGSVKKKLQNWVCRSADGGKTWERSSSVILPDGVEHLTPFGDVVAVSSRTLAAPFYYYRGDPPLHSASFLLFSEDDGRNWGKAAVIEMGDHNETHVLRLQADRWLAAARTSKDPHIQLFTSADEGRTWSDQGPLTQPSHIPGHLLKLSDGRVLATYGIREQDHHGIGIRVSEDEGRTWQAPRVLLHLENRGMDRTGNYPPSGALPGQDGGYPSTVELADGTLVTAYYSSGIAQHRRYHMGVARWRLPR